MPRFLGEQLFNLQHGQKKKKWVGEQTRLSNLCSSSPSFAFWVLYIQCIVFAPFAIQFAKKKKENKVAMHLL